MTFRGFAMSILLLTAFPAASVSAQQPADPLMTSTEPAGIASAFQMTSLQTSQPQIFAAIADRAFGVAMKSAVLPALFGEDSRYVASRSSNGVTRAAYAASRSLVTRSHAGHLRFNMSEIGGAGITAGLSNLYHPAADRSVTATLSRWGSQVLFDTLSNELKEFWPDVRRALHRS